MSFSNKNPFVLLLQDFPVFTQLIVSQKQREIF